MEHVKVTSARTGGTHSGLVRKERRAPRRFRLTGVQQHVAAQHALVRRDEAALRAAVDLLVGVQAAHVPVELHGVEGGEGAEGAAQLLGARVALALVALEAALVGAGEVAVRAVEGLVRAVVRLHGLTAAEHGGAGMVAALHGAQPVGVGRVALQLLPVGALEGAALLEAAQWLAVGRRVVALHVRLQGAAEAEGLAAGGAGVAVLGLLAVDAGQVAAQRVALHGTVGAQVAAVRLLAGLAQQVDAQLALAGEEVQAAGALQPGVGEVQVHVLQQVRALLKAAAALWADVCAEHVLRSLGHVTFGRGHSALVRIHHIHFTAALHARQKRYR